MFIKSFNTVTRAGGVALLWTTLSLTTATAQGATLVTPEPEMLSLLFGSLLGLGALRLASSRRK